MGKIIGVGPHYQCLLESKGVTLADKPFLFIKPTSSIIKTGSTIELPSNVEKVLAEVEIAIKMKKTVKNISVEEVTELAVIDGYAICNDVTAIGEDLPSLGKLYDTFTPIGEFFTIENPSEIKIESYRNGELQQSATASGMGYSIPYLVSYISSLFTLEEGDIILSGTPVGAFEIQKGDTIELRSPQLGEVNNRVGV
ncbi:fumarylacetoacetate hydrolase family protein [Anaerobacillus sp. CMMVII]|uniref:fumarylacetoacetate hydrolase family protein n=1 Tax=Anaerobacillus sp. CMMVII TaxID=2755588 RepID=UPI0021B7102D|nr:fumarylacetoacetate hydrolase family protein [Anaerobacillus sp. CMMVII]MCT8137648.1 fumarylacetoacetate hydrolase family protein [Anaerobacillus sp. CMMVII]